MNELELPIFQASEIYDPNAPLPTAIAPPLESVPEPPPLPLLKKGQRVAIADPAGDWVGIVHYDDGDQVDVVRGKSRPISYPRNQVSLLPELIELTTDPALLAQERELRRQQRERNPWVNCFSCAHHSPIDGATYRCQWLSFPLRVQAPYGTHIGCYKFMEKVDCDENS